MHIELKRVLFEGLVLAVIGLAFGLAANHFSPRGLALTRNYFPELQKAESSVRESGRTDRTQAAEAPGAVGAALSDAVTQRLEQRGLQPIDSETARQLFEDPQRAQELIIFVDARDDSHYRQGHIPGAYQFDRIYPEKHLLAVLPACLNALKIVVYCAGGECEDSEFAAMALRDAGVSAERLFVYAGGMHDWTANGRPVEIGEQRSGNLQR